MYLILSFSAVCVVIVSTVVARDCTALLGSYVLCALVLAVIIRACSLSCAVLCLLGGLVLHGWLRCCGMVGALYCWIRVLCLLWDVQLSCSSFRRYSVYIRVVYAVSQLGINSYRFVQCANSCIHFGFAASPCEYLLSFSYQ